MATFRVYDIVWVTDGKLVSLPSVVQISCEDWNSIADGLSDTFGWLVSDFKAIQLSEAHSDSAS